MAPLLPSSNNDDVLLQLALSINPTRSNPFDDSQQVGYDLNNDQAGQTNRDPDLFSQKVPAVASDPQSVDAMIASQMAKLSVDDREKVYMDVHGIPDYFVAETPEAVHLSLLDLQNEIELLPDKRAYNIAEKMDPSYVHDTDFRLAFLRCEQFDCPKAALRIVRHFQMKLDLFGVEKLVLHITQDDLDKDTMDAHYSCAARFLDKYDRAGRVINFTTTVPREFKIDPAVRKCFYHTNMVPLQDVEAQKRGCALVIVHNGGIQGRSGKNPELNWKLAKVNQASPMRMSAIHMCSSTEDWKKLQAISKSAMNESQQVRIRMHHGTVQEFLEELRGYGIDPAYIPISDKGEITDVEEARKRHEAQRKYERLNYPLRNTIHVPFSQDVLFGKGTPFQNHPGNMRFRELIADHIKQYDKSQKKEKKAIAFRIIDTIKQSGGLFLKQDGGLWTRVNDEVARLKVTAAFRTFRHSLRHCDD